MRPETSEALARLVSIYVTLIERAGYDISQSNVDKIHNDPFAACETLNELAVKFGALDAEADAVIAAIYESMDAADARSAADEACRAMAASAWETSHVERVVPEPEPEPAQEAAEDESEKNEGAQQDEKPKRRRRAKAKQDQDEPEKDEGDKPENEAKPTEPSDEPKPESAEAEQPADNKPGRRSRAKAKAERKPKASKSGAEKNDAPITTEGEQNARPETLGEAAARHDAAAMADSLSVDQAIAILGVSRPTIYKLIEAGELPAYKKGRSWRISAEAVAKRAAN